MKLKIIIEGKPKPKKRPRYSPKNGFFYSPSEEDEQDIKKLIMIQLINKKVPLVKDLKLNLEYHLKTQKHADIDNLIKLTMDALNELCYEDDKQIKELHAKIIYDNKEFTKVIIEEL
ncbi:MAG: RusA family crossover junction endodeoxyribonuclease, partial [Methanosarcinales archaeon]